MDPTNQKFHNYANLDKSQYMRDHPKQAPYESSFPCEDVFEHMTKDMLFACLAYSVGIGRSTWVKVFERAPFELKPKFGAKIMKEVGKMTGEHKKEIDAYIELEAKALYCVYAHANCIAQRDDVLDYLPNPEDFVSPEKSPSPPPPPEGKDSDEGPKVAKKPGSQQTSNPASKKTPKSSDKAGSKSGSKPKAGQKS